MSTVAEQPRAEAPAPAVGAGQQKWLVSPLFDLLFLANIGWVLAWLVSLGATTTERPHVEFWQVYFITTPHRWLTLVLVATDPDRRAGRTSLFLWMAVAAALIVLGTHQFTGAFTCLAVADSLWNAWHFAAQHGGILRMYARLGGGGRRRLENTAIRLLVLYTLLRLVGWATGWTESYPAAQAALHTVDLLVLVPAIVLLVLELSRSPTQRAGKVAYLASVCTLYGALLLSVRNGYHGMVIPLAVAAAIFHAVEYLAVVTYYAWRRQEQGSAAPFQTMARHWLRVLGFFVVILGMLAVFMDGDSQRTWLGLNLKETWLGLNLWAAFLHYAYDGMIWKLRRPATAKVLGVEVAGNCGKV
ncbi:MAG: hypothetical protein WDZ59_05430 [Pirellulales bacterium]